LLKDTNVATIAFENTPLYEQRHYELPGFDEYMKRRKANADKGIQAGLSVRTA